MIGRAALVRTHMRSLSVLLGVVAIGGVVSVAASLAPSHINATVGNVSALVALVAIAWAGYVVTCPRCHLRLLHHAMTTQPASSWLAWVLNVPQCPKCGYREGQRMSGRGDR